jgi:hypothetical protein
MTYEEFIKELDSYNSKSKSDPYAGMSLEEAFKKIGTEREWDKLVNELGNVRSGVTYQTGANEVKKSNDAYKSITNQLRSLYNNNKQYFSDTEAVEKYLSNLDANAAEVDKYAVSKKFTELYNGLGDAYNKLNKSKDTDSFKSANNEYGTALRNLHQFVTEYGSEIENKDLVKGILSGAFENAVSLDNTIKGGDEAISKFISDNFYGPLQNMSYEELVDISNGKTYQGEYDEDERRTIGAYALSKQYTISQYNESIKKLEKELHKISATRAKGSELYGSETDARIEEINNALSILKAGRTAYERAHKENKWVSIDLAADFDRHAYKRDYHIPTMEELDKLDRDIQLYYGEDGATNDSLMRARDDAMEDPLGFYLDKIMTTELDDPDNPGETYKSFRVDPSKTRQDQGEGDLSSYSMWISTGADGMWEYLEEDEINRYYYLCLDE